MLKSARDSERYKLAPFPEGGEEVSPKGNSSGPGPCSGTYQPGSHQALDGSQFCVSWTQAESPELVTHVERLLSRGRRSAHSVPTGSRISPCWHCPVGGGSLFCCVRVLPGNMAADSNFRIFKCPRASSLNIRVLRGPGSEQGQLSGSQAEQCVLLRGLQEVCSQDLPPLTGPLYLCEVQHYNPWF